MLTKIGTGALSSLTESSVSARSSGAGMVRDRQLWDCAALDHREQHSKNRLAALSSPSALARLTSLHLKEILWVHDAHCATDTAVDDICTAGVLQHIAGRNGLCLFGRGQTLFLTAISVSHPIGTRCGLLPGRCWGTAPACNFWEYAVVAIVGQVWLHISVIRMGFQHRHDYLSFSGVPQCFGFAIAVEVVCVRGSNGVNLIEAIAACVLFQVNAIRDEQPLPLF